MKKWKISVAELDFTFNFYESFKHSGFLFAFSNYCYDLPISHIHILDNTGAVDKCCRIKEMIAFFRATVVLFWRVSTVKSSSEDYSGRRQRPKTGYCKATERIHSATRKQTGQ